MDKIEFFYMFVIVGVFNNGFGVAVKLYNFIVVFVYGLK